MKVLVLADLAGNHASGRQRLWAIEQEAAEVQAISKHEFIPRFPRICNQVARLMRRPLWLKDGRRLANVLVTQCDELQPDVIWLEWPREITSETIDRIRRVCPKATLLSFQDDNPWGHRAAERWLWKNYFQVVPLFDLHLVKRVSDMANLTSLGAKNCREWVHGVYPPLFYPPRDDKARIYPMTFVGTCMDQRARLIGDLLDAGLPVHVFGSHWEKFSSLPRRFPNQFHPAVMGEAYAEVLRQSKIGLGLVSESNCDEWTMRTFEVPACETMLLAQRTPAHEGWYAEGIEAEFFTDARDCIEQANALLAEPDRCQSIARAGHKKCQQLGTLRDKVAELFDEIKQGLFR